MLRGERGEGGWKAHLESLTTYYISCACEYNSQSRGGGASQAEVSYSWKKMCGSYGENQKKKERRKKRKEKKQLCELARSVIHSSTPCRDVYNKPIRSVSTDEERAQVIIV